MIGDHQVRPFLALFGVLLEPPRHEPVRYDETRMLLLVEGVPAVLVGVHGLGDGTLHTAIRQETTDDR